MTQATQYIGLAKATDAATDLHRFSHKAMATIYEIFIVHEDANYAQQAAYEAFFELDKLEQELSRFIENSDISRINNLPDFSMIQATPIAGAVPVISPRP